MPPFLHSVQRSSLCQGCCSLQEGNTHTPFISHRFVSTKYIYYCGSKNLKREKIGVQAPISGNTRSASLFAGRQRAAAAEPGTTPQAAGSRGDAELQTMTGTLPPVLKEIMGMTEPQASQCCLSTSKSVFKATMGENGYFLVQNYLVMAINPS